MRSVYRRRRLAGTGNAADLDKKKSEESKQYILVASTIWPAPNAQKSIYVRHRCNFGIQVRQSMVPRRKNIACLTYIYGTVNNDKIKS